MKQLTNEELLKLKYEIAPLLDSLDSYENIIKVYYASLSVLQYFDSLGEDKVSQIDLQFWVHANEQSIKAAQQIEEKIAPMFTEVSEFEDALLRARHMCFHPYGNPKRDLEYYRLLEESAKRRDHYRDLRQLAAVYLDILSDKPQDEHYKLWRYYYDRLSGILDEKRRGFAEEDETRLSLAEMEMMLQELKGYHHIGEYAGCWDKEIKRFEEMIEKRKAEA